MPIIDSIMESMVEEAVKNPMNKSASIKCSDKALLNDKKFIRLVNKAYNKYPIDKEIKSYAKQYGVSYSQTKKNMNMDNIKISGSSTGTVNVDIWFNSTPNQNFLGGHSYVIHITVDMSSYEVTSIKSALEG